MIQRLRMGINKEPADAKSPQKGAAPKLTEGLKIPSFDDIEAPTQSVTDMFAMINQHGTRNSSGGAKADFAQMQTTQPTDILKLTSDDLLAQMSPQQKENWQKLCDFIDNWVAEDQAK